MLQGPQYNNPHHRLRRGTKALCIRAKACPEKSAVEPLRILCHILIN